MKIKNNYNISKIDHDDFWYYEVENFNIYSDKCKNQSSLSINGISFLIPYEQQTFYHMLLGLISQVALIKNIIKKNIEIYVYLENTSQDFIKKDPKSYHYTIINKFEPALSKLGINVNLLFIDDYKTITFEKIVFVDYKLIFMLYDFLKKHDLSTIQPSELVYKYAKALRNEFKQILHTDKPINKKVFISRKDHSDRLRENANQAYIMDGRGYIKILENEIIYGENFNPNVDFQKDGTPTQNVGFVVEVGIDQILSRYISKRDEEMIENFFKSHGYQIVDFNEMPVNQQMELLSQTSHLATLMGSNLVNTLFLPDDAKIFVINNNPPYSFTHDYYLSRIFKDARYIFSEGTDRAIAEYSADEIINFITKNYIHEI